jgi:hypothetical protein
VDSRLDQGKHGETTGKEAETGNGDDKDTPVGVLHVKCSAEVRIAGQQ